MRSLIQFRPRLVGLRQLAFGGLATLMALGIGLTFLQPAAQAAGTYDKNVTAGIQNDVDRGYLANVASCTYYVNGTSGIDGGIVGPRNGTTEKWKTINYGVSRLQPGNTLCVENGTYAEPPIRPTFSGNPTQPITVRALNVHGATITPTASTTVTAHQFHFDNYPASFGYWVIDGFKMDLQQRNGAGVYFNGNTNPIHHMTIRNNQILNSKSGGVIYFDWRVSDVYLRNNIISGHSRWGVLQPGGGFADIQYTKTTPSHERIDSNGITLQGAIVNDGTAPSIQRVRIEGNTLQNNGGDGVQRLGANDDSTTKYVSDPSDIDIVDNKMMNTASTAPTEENGVDIKSCARVSIRGSDDGNPNTPPTGSKISELLPTLKADDASTIADGTIVDGANNSDGTAIVIHYKARNILIENTRM